MFQPQHPLQFPLAPDSKRHQSQITWHALLLSSVGSPPWDHNGQHSGHGDSKVRGGHGYNNWPPNSRGNCQMTLVYSREIHFPRIPKWCWHDHPSGWCLRSWLYSDGWVAVVAALLARERKRLIFRLVCFPLTITSKRSPFFEEFNLILLTAIILPVRSSRALFKRAVFMSDGVLLLRAVALPIDDPELSFPNNVTKFL